MLKLKNYIASQFEGPLLSGPLLVICRFHLPLSKTMIKQRKAYLASLPHWRKPDGDNLEKFLFDCCTRIIWTDDAQVSWMIRSKVWTDELEGFTELFVSEMPEDKFDLDNFLKVLWVNLK